MFFVLATSIGDPEEFGPPVVSVFKDLEAFLNDNEEGDAIDNEGLRDLAKHLQWSKEVSRQIGVFGVTLLRVDE